MKKVHIFALISALSLSIFTSDLSALNVGGKKLVKNGVGRRTMLITVYYASLYVTPGLKGKTGKEIIESNKSMAVILKVDTRALSNEKFIKATRKGFIKAANSGYSTGKSEDFLKLFDKIEISKYDVISMIYAPGKGLTAKYKSKESGKNVTLGTIKGLDFKKALYAIWLGPDPVQNGCKKGMLGK